MNLTKEILRLAASRVAPGRKFGAIYMCHAVEEVEDFDLTVATKDLRAEFEAELVKQGVSTKGSLSHRTSTHKVVNVHDYCTFEEIQEWRFDFLNLLAEAWDDL